MSWIEQLNNVECTIELGDGRKFTPLWREAKRSKNYNTSAYNFINVPGTLIDRRMPEGYQYDLTLIFSGASHLDTALQFQKSADDRRFWTITHPFWGSIKVQPISLEEDKTVLNNTVFRIKVWETIPFNYPWQKQFANDGVSDSRTNMNELAAMAFENQVIIDTSVRTTLLSSVEAIDNQVSKSLTDDSLFADFKTAVSTAKVKINDTIQSGSAVMLSIIDLINFPVETVQSVADRLNIFNELKTKLTDIILKTGTKNELSIYESILSPIIGAMAVAAMTPSESDYQLRTEIIAAVDLVRASYEDYLQVLDEQMGLRSDNIDSFTPDSEVLRELNNAVMEALANIYDYALGAKQERVVYLEEDSNAIVLAHRFYGLDKEDVNLIFFINSNSLNINELIEIKKGRKIYYYI